MYVTRVRFQIKRFLAPKSSLQPTGTIDLKTGLLFKVKITV